MKPWQIVTIPPEDDDNSLPGALGISKERKNVLVELTELESKKSNFTSEILENVTGQCSNINEAIFTAFVLGNECRNCPIPDLPKGLIEFFSENLGGEFGSIFKINLDKNKQDKDIEDKSWHVSKVKDSNSIPNSLGISDKRSDELKDKSTKLLLTAIKEELAISDILVNLSRMAKNANESALIIFQSGFVIEKIKDSPIGFLLKVFTDKNKE